MTVCFVHHGREQIGFPRYLRSIILKPPALGCRGTCSCLCKKSLGLVAVLQMAATMHYGNEAGEEGISRADCGLRVMTLGALISQRSRQN